MVEKGWVLKSVIDRCKAFHISFFWLNLKWHIGVLVTSWRYFTGRIEATYFVLLFLFVCILILLPTGETLLSLSRLIKDWSATDKTAPVGAVRACDTILWYALSIGKVLKSCKMIDLLVIYFLVPDLSLRHPHIELLRVSLLILEWNATFKQTLPRWYEQKRVDNHGGVIIITRPRTPSIATCSSYSLQKSIISIVCTLFGLDAGNVNILCRLGEGRGPLSVLRHERVHPAPLIHNNLACTILRACNACLIMKNTLLVILSVFTFLGCSLILLDFCSLIGAILRLNHGERIIGWLACFGLLWLGSTVIFDSFLALLQELV